MFLSNLKIKFLLIMLMLNLLTFFSYNFKENKLNANKNNVVYANAIDVVVTEPNTVYQAGAKPNTPEEKNANITSLFKNFKFADTIKSSLNKILKPFDSLYSQMLTNSKSKAMSIIKTLFYLVTIYEIAKKYLENDYKSIIPTLVYEVFKYTALFTFISGGFYFLIPEEIIRELTGGGVTVSSLANASPTTIATDIITSLFNAWDNVVIADLTLVYDAYNTASQTFFGAIQSIPPFFELIFGFLIAAIGYILLTVACLGVVIKSIEFTIAIPISVFLICLRVIKITHEYHNIGMGYIVAAVIDFAILSLVVKLAITDLLVVGSAGLIDLLKGLFSCILIALLVKVAPKIGSGIVSGRPAISMSDASGIFSQVALAAAAGASILKSVAMPAAGAVGAVAGAANAVKAGGGAVDAMKGAFSGAKGASKAAGAAIGGKSLGSSASNSLGG